MSYKMSEQLDYQSDESYPICLVQGRRGGLRSVVM